MAAQVLRDKGAVTKMDYIICTGTVRRRDLCKFNRGLLANITRGTHLQRTAVLPRLLHSLYFECEAAS